MATNAVNPAAPQVVIQNYFDLVQAIAGKIKRRLPAHVEVEDLVQTGMIGLLEASSRFDASRAVDFSSYANSRITGAILDELRRLDKCSRQDRRNARAIESARATLRAKTGEEPSGESIAAAVGMGLSEYDRTLQRLESARQPAFESREADPLDELSRVPSSDQSPFEACSKREDFKFLKSYVDRLKAREREVLRLYYFEDLGLREIGERMGVGEARISQIHKHALGEVRRMIEAAKRSPGSKPPAIVH
ncbi:MAG TPA: FliA/WhiG family RNA polymerase sigma factor [Candidatus Angelobacter sp.]|nr:FliA/WhiG family RNA polymerase sigma factor [Candidatus Angelobacter sp.]